MGYLLHVMRSVLVLGVGVLCLTRVEPGLAQDAAQSERELSRLRAQINTLQKSLEAGQAKKSRAERRLLDSERQINEVARSLRRIDSALEDNRARLRELQTDRQRQAKRLAGQRAGLAAEARAAYVMGRQQQVKLLLNQEQPAAVGRALVYFGYLSRARMQQIEAVRASLQQLRDLEQAIGDKNRELSELRSRHEEQTRRLQEQKRAREELVTALVRELENQGGQLKRLKNNEQQLEKLVASLQQVLNDIPAESGERRAFRTLKGQLRWPTQGQLVRRFGSQRGSSGLKWQGVLIAAPEGRQVRAISAGRVAFADWMRGFGLLLIIEHGDGYMSLYGHTQALYKEVGEWVDTGEVVATLGASGGQQEAGLYFELRHKGRPVDPLKWCAGVPAPGAG